jgi:hypothetical protein
MTTVPKVSGVTVEAAKVEMFLLDGGPSPGGCDPCIFTVWSIEAGGYPKFVTAFPGPPPSTTS